MLRIGEIIPQLYRVKISLTGKKIKEVKKNEISNELRKFPKQVEMQINIADMNFKLLKKDLMYKLKKQNGVIENASIKIDQE